MNDHKIAMAGATLHAFAMELSDTPADAIGALAAALGSMISLNAKDDSREHALEACDLMAKLLRDGTNSYFDLRDRDEATIQ